MTDEVYSDFHAAATQSVRYLREAGHPDAAIITELLGLIAHMDKCLSQKHEALMALTGIAPRRIAAPDGRVYVWHCPDDLVPLTESPFSADWGDEMRALEPGLDTAHADG